MGGKQSSIRTKETISAIPSDSYTSDRINRAPGLGNRGLSPINPLVVAVRGVGDRGGGENRPVKFNRTVDPRGESPAVLAKLTQVPETGMLSNERSRYSRQGQLEESLLRAPRRILP